MPARSCRPLITQKRGAEHGGDNTVPFGSTYSLQPEGTILFANAAYPDRTTMPLTRPRR